MAYPTWKITMSILRYLLSDSIYSPKWWLFVVMTFWHWYIIIDIIWLRYYWLIPLMTHCDGSDYLPLKYSTGLYVHSMPVLVKNCWWFWWWHYSLLLCCVVTLFDGDLPWHWKHRYWYWYITLFIQWYCWYSCIWPKLPLFHSIMMMMIPFTGILFTVGVWWWWVIDVDDIYWWYCYSVLMPHRCWYYLVLLIPLLTRINDIHSSL